MLIYHIVLPEVWEEFRTQIFTRRQPRHRGLYSLQLCRAARRCVGPILQRCRRGRDPCDRRRQTDVANSSASRRPTTKSIRTSTARSTATPSLTAEQEFERGSDGCQQLFDIYASAVTRVQSFLHARELCTPWSNPIPTKPNCSPRSIRRAFRGTSPSLWTATDAGQKSAANRGYSAIRPVPNPFVRYSTPVARLEDRGGHALRLFDRKLETPEGRGLRPDVDA